MKKITVLMFVLAVALGGTVAAQTSAEWSKDPRLIAQWFANNANAQKFMDWGKANLTTEQIAGIEAMMFPDPAPGEKAVALDIIAVQMEQMNLEKSNKALYDAVQAALADAREESKADSPATP